MARRFATDLDLLGFRLLNALLNPVSSDPTITSGTAGQVWYNTSASPPSLKFSNGTTAIDIKDLASATGSLTSAKISDLATTVQAYKLSQFAAPNADVSLGSHKLTNVTDPSSSQDAATKAYVDTALSGVASGQIVKGAVRVAATTNITLATPGATIQSVSLASGDVVLLTAQTTGSQNGPYVWTGASTLMTRATNWNTSPLAQLGSYWIVEQGTYADNFAMLTNDAALTLGTDTPLFTFVGSKTYSPGNGIAISGSTISAVQNTGITVGGSGIGADFAVVARKFTGTIPTTSSGQFTVATNVITINHGLSNSAPLFAVVVGSSPASGYTTGQPVEMDYSCTDTNNITLTLPGASAPGASNWNVTVIG